MQWKEIEDTRNLASTYQQVLQNMLYIQEEIIPGVANLDTRITDETRELTRRHNEDVQAIRTQRDIDIGALTNQIQNTSNRLDEAISSGLDSLDAKYADTVATLVDKVEDLEETTSNLFTNPVDPATGASLTDIATDEDGVLRVLGMSIGLDDITVESPPSHYVRNVTFELKNISAVRLDDKKGVTRPLVAIMTVHFPESDGEGDYDPSSPQAALSNHRYPAWQLAFVDEDPYIYYRREDAEDPGVWQDWTAILNVKSIVQSITMSPSTIEYFKTFIKTGGNGIVYADAQPGNQEIGDIWLSPIVVRDSHDMQVSGMELDLGIWDTYPLASYVMFDMDGNEMDVDAKVVLTAPVYNESDVTEAGNILVLSYEE